MNFASCLLAVLVIICISLLPNTSAFSAVPMNRINAYRQMLPADFEVASMPSLRPMPENKMSPPRFGQFGFPLYGYSGSLSSTSAEDKAGSNGAKRAHLLRLANQAARGFGK